MQWFQDCIEAAVEKSKSQKAVFVVFVEGKDDISQSLAQTLNSTEVSSQLDSEKFVAIKIQSESNTYTLFADIYKVVPIPSIFFIGTNGKPLEVISNTLSPSELVSKINAILVKSNPQAKHSTDLRDNEQKAHSSNCDKISTNSLTSDFNQSSSNYNVNSSCSATACSEPMIDDGAAAESVTQDNEDMNKELTRAKQLIELKNKKKLEEDERKEREREMERRKMGKESQKWRKQQQDRQYIEAHEERMKEKAAEAAARERILKQIAEDKLERKRKFEMSVQEKNAKKQNKAAEAAQAQPVKSSDMTRARIQFKSPTGNIIIGCFEATNTLDTLRTYVIQNANLPFRQFSMSAFFPRRDFTSEDNNKTLLELELVPSAVILILPIKSNNQGTIKKSDDGGNIFSFFFWTLVAPVISVYNYVMGYFRGRPAGGGNDNENESRNPGSTRLGNLNVDFGQFANLRARLNTDRTAKIKSRGNVHTLHSGDNDNDENNTWNGNSTQQM